MSETSYTALRIERGAIVVGLVLAAALVVGVGATGGVGAEPVAGIGEDEQVSPPGESAIVVDLEESGDATITVTLLTYDLDDETAEATFDDLREDEEWRATQAAQFEEQWESIAADAAEQTDREMSIDDASIEFETVDDTGTVRLSLTWTNLAAAEEDQLLVTEPFSTMEESPQALYIVLPDDHELTTVETPDEPSETAENHLMWETESELSGFSLAASSIDETDESTDDGTTDDRDDETDTNDRDTDDGTATDDDEDSAGDQTADDDSFGPGFDIVTTLGAILVALFAVARRAR